MAVLVGGATYVTTLGAALIFVGILLQSFLGADQQQLLRADLNPQKSSQDIVGDLKPHPIDLAKHIIRNTVFPASGTLKSYLETLPTEFSYDLLKLGGQSTLLDAGCGEAYFAEQYVALTSDIEQQRILIGPVLMNFKALLSKPSFQRAKTVAVDLKIRRTGIPSYGGRLKILTGRFFEEIPIEDIGPTDLITDLFGVFAYSPRVDDVLRRYFSLLKNQGTLYIFFGDEKENYGLKSFIEKQGGKIPLIEWVRRIPGLQVTTLKGSGGGRTAGISLKIQIKNRPDILVPELNLWHISDKHSGPPIRTYKLKIE
ncbi:MAG: hypothetical protein HY537_16170 [Deltaproteobacteria bacterium]|nr:hypothetical protein [Deltaproteobacteria bacterium]